MVTAVLGLLLAQTADAGEQRSSSGVQVTVRIDPLACIRDCGGSLSATGADAPLWLVWLACGLVIAGVAFAMLRRSSGRRLVVGANPVVSTPYDGVIAHRSDSSDVGASPSLDASGAREGGDR